ncbi:flagellar hook-basal body complex protein [Clostridium sp. LP20]|uniref:flagellar hook-basal body complex protein n=1 Tax=Clostridium sp. LP20 TaxID=3418665 RepID=UPI003EE4BADC
MGYSLTNDDSSMGPSAQNPSTVTSAGFDFRFGPGSQLNGYKVVLGAIGPQTPTSADVDKASKLIILNGDFSTPGGLTASQVESAVNKGLSANGISQSVFVSGNPINIANLGSEGIKGGSSATAPGAVTFAGFNLKLSEGSELNGYTFEIRKVSSEVLEATVNTDAKKIIIDGDFITKGAITGAGLKEAINAALGDAKIEQTVTNVTGSPMNLSQIYGQTDQGVIATAPKMFDKDNNEITNMNGDFGGFNITVGNTAALNGYKIEFGDDTGDLKVTVDSTDKKIKIHGATANLTETEINTKIKNALTNAGIKDAKLEVSGTYDDAKRTNAVQFKEGKDAKAPKNVDLGGFTISFPVPQADSPFDDYEFAIIDVTGTDGSKDLKVEVDPTNPKRINISGDFVTPGGVTKSELQEKINAALNLTGDKQIKVSGQNKVYTGLTSSTVEGGDDDKAPEVIGVGGMVFEPLSGGALNGYKIQIGKVTAGTRTEATVDEKNKVITIDGDFTTPGATSSTAISNALSKALDAKGIKQGIRVSGNSMVLDNFDSDEILGGTPVQSIDGDGTINFVDGTKDLKSYDGTLKTLKIPDKVRIPGTDTELRVKTYTIDSTGVINGVLEDGRVAALGQIAMASFKNPEGLTKMGGNLYSGSVNSGDPIIKSGVGTLGEDNSKGYGDNLQGMLEMSNVDLAEQFTDMIVSSRAFQASGKMITTGDEILQDIINLKR